MYVQNDYLMRLIGELIRAAAKIAFGKTVQWNLYRDQASGIPEGRWEQYEELMRMVDAGEINEAENLLTDRLEPGDPDTLDFIEICKDELRARTGADVVLWDERGTSVTANRILSDAGKKRGKQRARVDAVAASVILQSYLDSGAARGPRG